MRFTARGIEALKPRSDRYDLLEAGGHGFGVRIAPSGRKTWIYLYHYGGRLRRMTLGSYPDMSLSEAHKAHAAARAMEDPAAPNVQARREALQAPTVNELSHEYLERWAKKRKRSWREDARILTKDVLPQWGRRKASNIQRRDVIALLDEINDRGAPIQANRTLACLRKVFNFAVARDFVGANPCAAVKAPSRENRRDRKLTSDEIYRFWIGLDDAPMAPGTALALKLQLVTAQRKGEIVSMRWQDIVDDVWTIPAEYAKNGLPHRVPLSPLALQLIEEARALAGDSSWLFPTRNGSNHIGSMAVDHALRRSRDVLQLSDLTPHDLRRTAASHMTGMGISRLTVSKILNHAENGITAVYDRHSYDTEKRQALDAWGRRLQEIIHGSQVVELHSRASL